jgi:hypothetical protein
MVLCLPDGTVVADESGGKRGGAVVMPPDGTLAARAAAFQAAGVRTDVDVASGNAASLWVLQHECATVLPGQFELLGSDDATTCHIVLLRARGGRRKCGCVHIDTDEAGAQMTVLMASMAVSSSSNSSCCDSIDLPFVSSDFGGADRAAATSTSSIAVTAAAAAAAPMEVEELAVVSEYDLWVVGGYVDEGNNSAPITAALLHYLLRAPHTFHLQLFFTGAANTIPHPHLPGKNHPWTRGAAMDTRTGSVFAFEATASAAGIHRVRRNLVQYTVPAVVVHRVFEAEQQQLRVGPFPYQVPKQIKVLAELPDEYVLQHCSTSPLAESARFPRELRYRAQTESGRGSG